MRKLNIILGLVFLLAFSISCEKETISVEDSNLELQSLKQASNSTFGDVSGEFQAPKLNIKNQLHSRQEIISKNIGIIGNTQLSEWTDLFTTNGHTVVNVDQSFINAGDLNTLDALYIFRGYESFANTNMAAIKAFVSNGGILITEYIATNNVLFNFNISSVPTGTTQNHNGYIGSYIVNIDQDHSISSNLPSSFNPGNQFGWYDTHSNLDANFNVFASALNVDVNNDQIDDPLAGTYCYGNGVWIAFFGDFGDLYSNSAPEELVLSINMIEYGLDSCNLTDRDDDGVLNEDDPYPNSNISAELSFDGCYPGVTNTYMGNGTFMADEVDAIIAVIWEKLNTGNHPRNYNPQKQFQRDMITLLNKWYRNDRVVTDREKFEITKCVRSSRIFDRRPS